MPSPYHSAGVADLDGPVAAGEDVKFRRAEERRPAGEQFVEDGP
jgi:hypothetical protein